MKIEAFTAMIKKVSKISKLVGRHKSTITRYFLLSKRIRERTPRQRVKKLTDRDTRQIVQTALSRICSAQKVKCELTLSVSVCIMQQMLCECSYTAYLSQAKLHIFFNVIRRYV